MEHQELENNLLEKAVRAFYRETGLNLIPKEGHGVPGVKIDATIEIEGYEYIRYTAEIKKWAQHANFGALVNQIEQLPMKGMLVADYVNPNMADKLRKMDVPFIDAAGNAYINEKPLYVFIKTNKAQTNRDKNIQGMKEAQKRGRAFKPTGLKVLYALIRDPQLIYAPYRGIADIAGVALGTVGWVINDLKQGGYLVATGKTQKRIKNKKQLLDKWVDAYLEKLRPKQFIGTFATENEYWWQDLDYQIIKYGARWGGEVAAAKLTGYLKPEKVIIYLPREGEKYMQLFTDQRMRKNPEGNIQVYRAFWNQELNYQFDDADIVDPLIVYADLLGTGDTRNLETARMIYDKELSGFIRED